MTNLAAVSEREFASALEAMTDDELFELMADLEKRSEALNRASPTGLRKNRTHGERDRKAVSRPDVAGVQGMERSA